MPTFCSCRPHLHLFLGHGKSQERSQTIYSSRFFSTLVRTYLSTYTYLSPICTCLFSVGSFLSARAVQNSPSTGVNRSRKQNDCNRFCLKATSAVDCEKKKIKKIKIKAARVVTTPMLWSGLLYLASSGLGNCPVTKC